MNCTSYLKFFEIIANQTRLNMIESLRLAPKSVTELAQDIGEEQSKVSHNLRLLTNCYFVSFRQEGKKRIYSLNKKTIVPLMDLVNQHVKAHCAQQCWKRKK